MVNNNNNQNKFIPESVKKPTYTVSYFNEVEWNKDLSKADLKQQELINTSYQSEIDNQERSYGPCPKLTFAIDGRDWTCNCTREQLLNQIREEENKNNQLRSQAKNDLDELWKKFKEYDESWESYKSQVRDYINQSDELSKKQVAISHAVSLIPGVGGAASLFVEVESARLGKALGDYHERKIREIYNNCIVNGYNRIRSWYNSTSSKYF